LDDELAVRGDESWIVVDDDQTVTLSSLESFPSGGDISWIIVC
jgi:hypothetical protein